jgi:hypothetical protein
MMGRHTQEQRQLFYSFDLDAVVPDDHLVRRIAAVLIYHGFTPSWRRTIPPLAGPRSIRR